MRIYKTIAGYCASSYAHHIQEMMDYLHNCAMGHPGYDMVVVNTSLTSFGSPENTQFIGTITFGVETLKNKKSTSKKGGKAR